MTLLSLAIAFVLGIFFASWREPPLPALALFLVATLLVLALVFMTRRSILPSLLLLGFVLGMARFAIAGDTASDIVPHHSRLPVQVEGVITSEPEAAGAFTRFRLRVDKVGAEAVSGDVLVTLRETAELARLRDRPFFRYGDRLLLQGALEAPQELEEFDYPAYLARQGVGTVMPFPSATLLGEGEGVFYRRWLSSARGRIADSLSDVVSEPQASLGQALLLGIRDNLPEGMVEDFRAAGASHILAISGLHIGIVLGIGIAAGAWAFGRRRQLYLLMPLVAIWSYALISSMSPSVTRAAIMGSFYLAAIALGRPRSILPSLALAAVVMAVIGPKVIWSVSFQLSFAAMAGIALLAEPLNRLVRPYVSRYAPPLGFLTPIVTMTIAATFATLPLVAFYFQQVSLVGILTTILVLPMLPFVLVGQAIAGFVGLISTSIALPLGWLAWGMTAYVTFVVSAVADLPASSIQTGRLASVLVWLYYGALLLPFAWRPLRRAVRRWTTSTPTPPQILTSRAKFTLALIPLLTVTALMWTAALSGPDSQLRVVFVDVGQGDGIFISTPSGQQILVDGGPDPLAFTQFLGGRMPFRDRQIELVVLTHAHSDHVNGLLEVLRRYDVERVLERQVDYGSPPYVAWRKALEIEGAGVIQAQAGQKIAFDDSVLLEVVSPPEHLLRGTASDVDNASVVIRLTYGEVSFLLTGDLFSEGERLLVTQNAPLDSDVLKVGHHGSRSSSTEVFLDRVSPSIAVISAGEDNSFGHPHSEVVTRLGERIPGGLLFTTQEGGSIEFITDGARLEVIREN